MEMRKLIRWMIKGSMYGVKSFLPGSSHQQSRQLGDPWILARSDLRRAGNCGTRAKRRKEIMVLRSQGTDLSAGMLHRARQAIRGAHGNS